MYINREYLVLRLACNNVFELVKDKTWQHSMLEYFETENKVTIEQAAHECNIDTYSVVMTLGQMIKVGLAGFDKDSGEPWNSMNQHFTCKTDNLLSR